jgi:hypothetical protein
LSQSASRGKIEIVAGGDLVTETGANIDVQSGFDSTGSVDLRVKGNVYLGGNVDASGEEGEIDVVAHGLRAVGNLPVGIENGDGYPYLWAFRNGGSVSIDADPRPNLFRGRPPSLPLATEGVPKCFVNHSAVVFITVDCIVRHGNPLMSVSAGTTTTSTDDLDARTEANRPAAS